MPAIRMIPHQPAPIRVTSAVRRHQIAIPDRFSNSFRTWSSRSTNWIASRTVELRVMVTASELADVLGSCPALSEVERQALLQLSARRPDLRVIIAFHAAEATSSHIESPRLSPPPQAAEEEPHYRLAPKRWLAGRLQKILVSAIVGGFDGDLAKTMARRTALAMQEHENPTPASILLLISRFRSEFKWASSWMDELGDELIALMREEREKALIDEVRERIVRGEFEVAAALARIRVGCVE